MKTIPASEEKDMVDDPISLRSWIIDGLKIEFWFQKNRNNSIIYEEMIMSFRHSLHIHNNEYSEAHHVCKDNLGSYSD